MGGRSKGPMMFKRGQGVNMRSTNEYLLNQWTEALVKKWWFML